MAIGCVIGYSDDLADSDYVHDSDNVIASGGFGDARNASDNVTVTYIQQLTYCSIDFGAANSKTIRSLHLWAWNVTAYNEFKNGLFQGSNNNIDWDTLVDLDLLGSMEGAYPDWIEPLEFDNTTPYRYYRVSGLNFTTNVILAEWELKECIAFTHIISGTVKEKGTAVARTVRSYIRSTGQFYTTTVSQGDGSFSVGAPDDTTLMYVIALDDDAGEQYNALIFDRVRGVPI